MSITIIIIIIIDHTLYCCIELTKECSKLKDDLANKNEMSNNEVHALFSCNNSFAQTLFTELQVLKTEKDKAVTQFRDLQQSFTEQKLNSQVSL